MHRDYSDYLKAYISHVKEYINRTKLGISKFNETKDSKYLYTTGVPHHDLLAEIIAEYEKVIRLHDPTFKGFKE